MTRNTPRYIFILLLIAGVTFGFTALEEAGEDHSSVTNSEASAEKTPFDLMMEVLTHKRCVNCHPSDDRPRQGEDSHYHNFGVQRGADNHGIAALRCETCHQEGK